MTRKYIASGKHVLMNNQHYKNQRVSHPRRNKIISSYKIHNHILSSVDHHKYLGITIQNDLKWHQHIQSITSKANQTLVLLIRNLRTPSIQLRERTYFSLVPYGANVWRGEILTNLTNQSCIVKIFPINILHLEYKNLSASTYNLWPREVCVPSDEAKTCLLKYFE